MAGPYRRRAERGKGRTAVVARATLRRSVAQVGCQGLVEAREAGSRPWLAFATRRRVHSRAVALFEPLFDALEKAGVRYVVVGGVAVVLHGYARLTGDVDLAVDLRPAEARKAVATLTGLGLRPRLPVDAMEFADEDVRARWVAEKHMRVFTFIHPANPMLVVDCFAEDVVPFAALWDRSELVALGSTHVRVASIPDLIALKRLAARPQDAQDIEALEEILRRRGERG
jgi:hypothetical protein